MEMADALNRCVLKTLFMTPDSAPVMSATGHKKTAVPANTFLLQAYPLWILDRRYSVLAHCGPCCQKRGAGCKGYEYESEKPHQSSSAFQFMYSLNVKSSIRPQRIMAETAQILG